MGYFGILGYSVTTVRRQFCIIAIAAQQLSGVIVTGAKALSVV